MEMVVQLDEPEEMYFPRNGEEEGGGICGLHGKRGVWEQKRVS